jgi:hypothetical protein
VILLANNVRRVLLMETFVFEQLSRVYKLAAFAPFVTFSGSQSKNQEVSSFTSKLIRFLAKFTHRDSRESPKLNIASFPSFQRQSFILLR